MQDTQQPEPKLTWQAVLSEFDNLIKFAARQTIEKSPNGDSSVSAEDLYQEGLIKLHECYVKWCVGHNKDMDEFGPIFKKSLFRKVKQSRESNSRSVDLEGVAGFLEDHNSPDAIHSMYMRESLAHLSGMLSNEVSRRVLQELAEPSPRTIYEAMADAKRREMLKTQGKKVNVPKDYTIRMKHIVRSLGITGKQYDNAMLDIRQYAPLIF